MLGHFGIHPKSIRLPSGKTPKGYKRESFEDVWQRYLPGSAPATSATTADMQANPMAPEAPHPASVAGPANAKKPEDSGHVAVVAAPTLGHEPNADMAYHTGEREVIEPEDHP
jgi:hypothetical protein